VSQKRKRLTPQQRAAHTRKRNKAKQERAARERSERARKAARARWEPKPAKKSKPKKPKTKPVKATSKKGKSKRPKKSKKDKKIEALEKRLKIKEKRIERFETFFLTESLFNTDGSARFTELQNLPERRRYEGDEDYADRLIKLIQKEAIYSVDQAYRVIANKARLSPREVYTLFRSPKASAAA
jgi:hypothetical protein